MYGRIVLSTVILCAALAGRLAFLPNVAHAAPAVGVCKLSISGDDMMRFDQTELKVSKDCSEVEVTLAHTGKLAAQVMGHNWVLVKTADLAGVATEGLGAGLPNDYIKPGDARVIAHTKVIGGGQSTAVRFALSKLTAGESYSFLCTYPGHSAFMKGVFKIT